MRISAFTGGGRGLNLDRAGLNMNDSPMKNIRIYGKRMTIAFAVAWTGAIGPGSAGPGAPADPSLMDWKAGTARVAITPAGPMWMAGYGGRKMPAHEKNMELWAKALVLEDARENRVVLITMDLLGMERSLSQAIASRLEKQFGLARHQMAFCFSHTHSGPVVGYNLKPVHYDRVDAGQQARIREYAGQLEDHMAVLVGQAMEALEPAQLSWGNGLATFAVNRRTNFESHVAKARATGKLKGPVDPDVPVLAVRGLDGQLQAVVFGYACHATTLNGMQWDGDYPGYAQSDLEDRYPGAVAMFWTGCGADINPLPRRSLERARAYGRKLSDAVDTVLSGPMRSIPARLDARFREIPLPFVDPSHTPYPYPLAQWNLGGEINWLFLGGEVVVDYAIRLKSAQTGPRTWVTAFANDVMGYIPSARIQREGGYEASASVSVYGRPSAWADTIETLIINALFEHPPRDITLPADGWRFRADPDRVGHQDRWYVPTFDDEGWRSDVPIEASWQRHMETPYYGGAWYRRVLDLSDVPAWKRAFLFFEGVDEQAWVWVNGRLAGWHAIGPEGWNEPFWLEVTDILVPGAINPIAVRVENTTHGGGIWSPVRLQMYDSYESPCGQ